MKRTLKLLFSILLALVLVSSTSFAQTGYVGKYPTYDVKVSYVDAENGQKVAKTHKEVLAPGDTYSIKSPVVDGYELVDASQETISGTVSDKDTEYTVKYRNVLCEYKINHWLKDAGGTYQLRDTETATAKRGTVVAVEVDKHNGYRCVTSDLSLKIPESGTVTKDLYYDPITVSEPEEPDDTFAISFITHGSSVESIVGKAGTDVTSDLADRTTGSQKPTRMGYEFQGWDSNDPEFDPTASTVKMPNKNIKLTARWKGKKDTSYQVIYWFKYLTSQKNGKKGSYYQYKVVDKKGTAGEDATYDRIDEEANPACYEFEKADAVKVSGDGTTIVNVYYQPVEVTVNIYNMAERDAVQMTNKPPVVVRTIKVRLGDYFTGDNALADEAAEQKIIEDYKKYYEFVWQLYKPVEYYAVPDYSKCVISWSYMGYNNSGEYLGMFSYGEEHTTDKSLKLKQVKVTKNADGTYSYESQVYPKYEYAPYKFYLDYYAWDPNAVEESQYDQTSKAQYKHESLYTDYSSAGFIDPKYNAGDQYWGTHWPGYRRPYKFIPGSTEDYYMVYVADTSSNYDGTGDPQTVSSDLYNMKAAVEAAYGTRYKTEELLYWLFTDEYPNNAAWVDETNPSYVEGYTDPSNSHNYYGMYYVPKKYPVRYLSLYYNNGSTSENPHLMSNAGEEYFSKNITLNYTPTAAQTPEGYELAGWYTLDDPSTVIPNGSKVSVFHGNNDYYAKWQLEKCNVTFDSDGGTAVEPQRVTFDETAEEPPAPTKSGYTFKGWYYKGAKYDFDLPVEKDITLVAKWTKSSTSTAGEDKIIDYQVVHQMADGTVFKTEKLKGTVGHYVTAHALDVSDPDYPKDTLPDAFVKTVRLNEQNVSTKRITTRAETTEILSIVFTYTPLKETKYIVHHIDRDTGKKIHSDDEITDIAVIMTASARDIKYYVEEIKYGRGSDGEPIITIYYRKKSGDSTKTSVTARKTWEKPDGTLDKNLEHPSVWFMLYRSVNGGTAKPVMNADGDALIKQIPAGTDAVQTVTWNKMPKADKNGNPYTYMVREVDEDGNAWTPTGYRSFYKENDGVRNHLSIVNQRKKSGTQGNRWNNGDSSGNKPENYYPGGSTTGGGVPRTGDSAPLLPELIVLAGAAAGLILMVRRRKQKD